VAYPNLAENIKQLPMPENDAMWAAKIVAKGCWRAQAGPNGQYALVGDRNMIFFV
jgi:hypothetical protein